MASIQFHNHEYTFSPKRTKPAGINVFLAVAILALLFPTTASGISLSDFVPDIRTGLSAQCNNVYKGTVPVCGRDDFPSDESPNSTCSPACRKAMDQMVTLVQTSCARSANNTIPADSLLDFFLRGQGKAVLCGGEEPQTPPTQGTRVIPVVIPTSPAPPTTATRAPQSAVTSFVTTIFTSAFIGPIPVPLPVSTRTMTAKPSGSPTQTPPSGTIPLSSKPTGTAPVLSTSLADVNGIPVSTTPGSDTVQTQTVSEPEPETTVEVTEIESEPPLETESKSSSEPEPEQETATATVAETEPETETEAPTSNSGDRTVNTTTTTSAAQTLETAVSSSEAGSSTTTTQTTSTTGRPRTGGGSPFDAVESTLQVVGSGSGPSRSTVALSALIAGVLATVMAML